MIVFLFSLFTIWICSNCCDSIFMLLCLQYGSEVILVIVFLFSLFTIWICSNSCDSIFMLLCLLYRSVVILVIVFLFLFVYYMDL